MGGGGSKKNYIDYLKMLMLDKISSDLFTKYKQEMKNVH